MEETRLITLTHQELMRFGEGCAKMAADRALDEIRDQMKDLYASLHLVKGIVSRQDLALIYEKDPQTIRRWARRHDFKHVDGPDMRKIYYDIEDIKRRIRNE